MKNHILKSVISNNLLAKSKDSYTLKKIMLVGLLVFCASPMFAIAAQVNTYVLEVKTIMIAVVSLYVIIGGFLVFSQYAQGNQEAQKNLIKFVVGLVVLGLTNLFVTTFGTITP